jgi:hypothetical protein
MATGGMSNGPTASTVAEVPSKATPTKDKDAKSEEKPGKFDVV